MGTIRVSGHMSFGRLRTTTFRGGDIRRYRARNRISTAPQTCIIPSAARLISKGDISFLLTIIAVEG
jgi:hypothetical protein